MSPRHVHAAAFAVLRIAHLGQAAALQVVATALELALGRARLWRDRQQHQRCRQHDDKSCHDASLPAMDRMNYSPLGAVYNWPAKTDATTPASSKRRLGSSP